MRTTRPPRWLSALGLGGALAVALALPTGVNASSAGSQLASAKGIHGQGGQDAALVLDFADHLEISPTAPIALPVASTGKVKLPPALVALEHKMQSLRINSVRGRVIESLSGVSLGPLLKGTPFGSTKASGRKHAKRRSPGRKVPTRAGQRVPFLTADYEESISPKLADVREVLLGGLSFQARVIGEQTYVSSSLFSALDGGRRWLSVSAAELAEANAKSKGKQSQSSVVPEVDGAEDNEAGYGKLANLIATTRSVHEVGPASVDGQHTLEFEGRLAPEQLAGFSTTTSALQKRSLRHAKGSLEVYIAADGLPVRTKLQIQLGKASVEVDSDILATEIPVSVTAPPASETITEAELKQHEESGSPSESHPLGKREKAEEKRFNACMKRQRLPKRLSKVSRAKLRKALQKCERVAHRGSK